MGRPRKNTIDFFPHFVNHGKTMFALERQYGNDGYAAWFKLLELLGRTSGHYYEFKNSADFHYLSATLGVSGEKTTEILGFLSEMDAIDPKLFKNGIIWSDNFVENLKPVYSKRNSKIPEKPTFRTENPSSLPDNPPLVEFPERSGPETPQSRVDESKVKNTLLSKVPIDESFSDTQKSEADETANFMADCILSRDPGYRFLAGARRDETIRKWSEDIEKIHRLDGRPWEQIRSVTEWGMNDTFWSKNILSGSKLRKQFEQLVAKMPINAVGQDSTPDFMQGAL